MSWRNRVQKTRINRTISIRIRSRKNSRYKKRLKRFTWWYDRRITTSINK